MTTEIRIPEPIPEQCGFTDTVELTVEGDVLRLTRARKPQGGWDAVFRMEGAVPSDELLLDGVGPNAFDSDEWQW